MSNEDVVKLWDKEWTDYSSVHESGTLVGKWLHSQRMNIIKKMVNFIPIDVSTIDIGCGGGETLKLLRNAGFKNTIGIDLAPHAIKKAEQVGFIRDKDVFLLDGADTKYPNRKFTFVFSEGLWEHFENPLPFINEACRLSDEWLMVVQPDHFSFFGGLLHWGWERFSKKGVLEYSFRMEFFIDSVAKNGLKLVSQKGTYLNEQRVLLFRRIEKITIDSINADIREKWKNSQQLEQKYNKSGKPKSWGVPYSFKYWADFVDLVDFDGLNIEVGCGSDGFWRFSDKIIGTDSLDFSDLGKNFTQTIVEHLPFKDNHFRDGYAINMLDHTIDPKIAINEMVRVTSHRLYIITNTYSPLIKPLMKIFDTMHPYHFTDKDIMNLVPDTVTISKVVIKEFTELKTAKLLQKLKLLFAKMLGTHRLLIHLDKKQGEQK